MEQDEGILIYLQKKKRCGVAFSLLPMMKGCFMLTNYERETIITFNEAEADCEVYTYNPKLVRKLTERCESHPSLYRMIAEDQFGGYTFCFPKSLLTINPRVPMSEDLREKHRRNAIENGLGKNRGKS